MSFIFDNDNEFQDSNNIFSQDQEQQEYQLQFNENNNSTNYYNNNIYNGNKNNQIEEFCIPEFDEINNNQGYYNFNNNQYEQQQQEEQQQYQSQQNNIFQFYEENNLMNSNLDESNFLSNSNSSPQDLSLSKQKSTSIDISSFEETKSNLPIVNVKKAQKVNNNNGNKRTKERFLQDVLDLVYQYRKFKDEGIYVEKYGCFMKLSLAQCAEKVGISKKSLDDYHLQIERAKSFGFDFSKHSEEKFGVVRQFNKIKKLQQKQQQLQ